MFSGIGCVYVLPVPVTLSDLPVDNLVVPAYDASNGTPIPAFFQGSAAKGWCAQERMDPLDFWEAANVRPLHTRLPR